MTDPNFVYGVPDKPVDQLCVDLTFPSGTYEVHHATFTGGHHIYRCRNPRGGPFKFQIRCNNGRWRKIDKRYLPSRIALVMADIRRVQP